MATSSLRQSEEPLDTTVRLVTPERIVFRYPLAGPFRRYVAYLIDVVLVFVAVVVTGIALLVLSLGSLAGLGPIFVAYFVIMWGYRGFCEVVLNGQTLGKRIVGLRVVSDRGVPITPAQAVLRNLVGSLDGTVPYFLRPDLTSMLLLFGLTSMLLTRKFQRLGDLAAGTMVVVEERRPRYGVVRVKEPEVEALLPWLPLRVAAGPELRGRCPTTSSGGSDSPRDPRGCARRSRRIWRRCSDGGTGSLRTPRPTPSSALSITVSSWENRG